MFIVKMELLIPRGNILLEICTPDIRISRMSAGYTGIINGYQEKIDHISIKYLTDFGRILKTISWIYLNINQISVNSGQRAKKLEKLLKTATF